MALDTLLQPFRQKVLAQGICSIRCYREIESVLEKNEWPVENDSFDHDAFEYDGGGLHLVPQSTLVCMSPRQRVGYEKFRTALYLPVALGAAAGRSLRGMLELPSDPSLHTEPVEENVPLPDRLDTVLGQDSLWKSLNEGGPGNHSVTAQTAYCVKFTGRSLAYSTLGMTLGLLTAPMALIYGFFKPIDEKEEGK